jgi:hypothetical protein
MAHPEFRCTRWLLAAVLFLSCGRAVLAGENYAFLASVQQYDEKEFRSLKFSRADMEEFRKTLLASGFAAKNIVWMHDDVARIGDRRFLPESAKIRRQLELLLETLEPGDTLVVAFAGHGVQFKGEKQSWFCPADAVVNDRSTLISLSDIYKSLEGCRATRKLLLVDACRNDPLTSITRARATVDIESVTRPQTESIPEGIAALFSCSEGQFSLEPPELGHGLFFHQVIQGWKGPADVDKDGRITFEELAAFVKKETKDYARLKFQSAQVPALKGDVSGEWVLRTLDGTSQANIPSTPPRNTLSNSQKPSDGKPTGVQDTATHSKSDVERRLEVAEKELERAEKLLAAGVMTRTDYDQAKLRVAAIKTELIEGKTAAGEDLTKLSPSVLRFKLLAAEKALERMTQLFTQKVATQSQYDQAKNRVDAIEAELEKRAKQPPLPKGSTSK